MSTIRHNPTQDDTANAPAGRIASYHSAWEQAVRDAGLAGLVFRDLRRSARRTLKEAGLDRLQIKRTLGHKTDLILDRYDIRYAKDTQLAGEQLDGYWNEKAASRRPALVQ